MSGNVLLLKLAGPLQSWGTGSKFETRDTGRMPSKSGVCGLLAAALGRPRDFDNSDLAALRFGVRADREGVLLDEFQTARSLDVPGEQAALYKKLYGLSGKDYSSLIHKHYLMDAVFLAGFEGDPCFLSELADALKRPVYIPYLGRRCCPPAGRVFYGMRDGDLLSILDSEPGLCEWKSGRAWYQVDADGMRGKLLHDVPVSYDPARRTYGYRSVVEGYVEEKVLAGEADGHDPMAALEFERKGGGVDVSFQDMA